MNEYELDVCICSEHRKCVLHILFIGIIYYYLTNKDGIPLIFVLYFTILM
jgi:hypothetical protein